MNEEFKCDVLLRIFYISSINSYTWEVFQMSRHHSIQMQGLSQYQVASHADILLARHAIFPPQRGEERLRDEPKECLRGRLSTKLYSESL